MNKKRKIIYSAVVGATVLATIGIAITPSLLSKIEDHRTQIENDNQISLYNGGAKTPEDLHPSIAQFEKTLEAYTLYEVEQGNAKILYQSPSIYLASDAEDKYQYDKLVLATYTEPLDVKIKTQEVNDLLIENGYTTLSTEVKDSYSYITYAVTQDPQEPALELRLYEDSLSLLTTKTPPLTLSELPHYEGFKPHMTNKELQVLGKKECMTTPNPYIGWYSDAGNLAPCHE